MPSKKIQTKLQRCSTTFLYLLLSPAKICPWIWQHSVGHSKSGKNLNMSDENIAWILWCKCPSLPLAGLPNETSTRLSALGSIISENQVCSGNCYHGCPSSSLNAW